MSIIKLNNRAVKDATAVGTTTSLGNLVFISRSTASSSSSVDITSGISSTYKEYIFILNNMHPETNDKHFTFQVNANILMNLDHYQFHCEHLLCDNLCFVLNLYQHHNLLHHLNHLLYVEQKRKL